MHVMGEPPPGFCHCLCQHVHPEQMGICDAFGATEILLFALPELGLASIPVCKACLEAALVNRSAG